MKEKKESYMVLVTDVWQDDMTYYEQSGEASLRRWHLGWALKDEQKVSLELCETGIIMPHNRMFLAVSGSKPN